MPEPARAAGRSLSREQLAEEARELWDTLTHGSVVWLTGDIGSGKTTFVQAVARAAGAAEGARSPTFALVHEYPTHEGSLYHVDCYRLRDPEEALDLDFSELLRRGRLILIEWLERAGVYAPPPDAHLHLAHTDRPDRRLVERRA